MSSSFPASVQDFFFPLLVFRLCFKTITKEKGERRKNYIIENKRDFDPGLSGWRIRLACKGTNNMETMG